MNTWLEDVYGILSTTPERWQRLVGVLSVDVLRRAPAEGEWSALDCLRHLLVVERELFPVRYHALLAGENFVNFDPLQPHPDLDVLSPEQLVASFVRYREESLPLLKQVRDDDLARTVQHPKLGTVNLKQLLHAWAAHDLNHTLQAERALIQPFMLGCGPWRVFYRDHEIAAPQG